MISGFLQKRTFANFFRSNRNKENAQSDENKQLENIQIFANKNLYKPIILKFQTLSDHPDYRIGLSFLRLIDNLRIAVQTNRIIDYSVFFS